MTTLLAFIPIIIIIAIIMFAIFRIPFLKTILLNYWLFTGYIAILLICWGLTSIHTREEVVNNDVKTNVLEKENNNLHNAAITGNLDKIGAKAPNKKWSFPQFQGQQLIIELVGEAQVVVERKKTKDAKIEVVDYKSRGSANGRELVANPYGIQLAGDTLIINQPQKLNFQYSEFKNAFPVTQFTKEQGIGGGSDLYIGPSLLYIKVPQNVEVVDKSNIGIEYVN